MMENNILENTNNGLILTVHLEDDLRQIAKWAKDVLFKTCKFLYRGKEELESTGIVFQKFEEDCMNSLQGVKAAEIIGTPYKHVYVKVIWDLARERRILSQALSLRRSCVYTVMQNRFNGKSVLGMIQLVPLVLSSNSYESCCHLSSSSCTSPPHDVSYIIHLDLCGECVTHNLIFPALEAFEDRLSNPTTYYLFYEYFLRAAVGEEVWKENTGHHTNTKKARLSSSSHSTTSSSSTSTMATGATPSTTKRMATSLDEAFALIVFKNNYFAWLLAAKQLCLGLLTDYDIDVSVHTSSITLVEQLLKGSVVNLQWDEDESDSEEATTSYVLWKPQGSADTMVQQNDRLTTKYVEAFNNYKLMVNNVRYKVQNSEDYRRLNDAITELSTATGDITTSEISRKKKKRRLLRDLKSFTGGRQGDEKAFRGWSGRAFIDLVDLKKAIVAQKDLYKRFGKAYRHLYAVQRSDTLALQMEQQPSNKPLLDDEQYKQLFAVNDDDSD